MKIKLLDHRQLGDWIGSIPPSMVVGMLLEGDRYQCCDEAVAISTLFGKIVGVATIAPEGEMNEGHPTIVALYVLPDFRKRGYGSTLMEAAIRRCMERGFAKVRVDVFSGYVAKIIRSLPDELQAVLDVRFQSDLMDRISG